MATIREIAKRSNVSIGTVDRVIHNRGKVKPEVAERIRRVMQELNYKPNVFARNLVLGKTFVFGVLLPMENQDSGYWQKTVQGIRRAEDDLKSQRVKVKYFHFNKFSERSFEKMAQKALDADVDGLLVTPGPEKAFHFFMNKAHNVPVVIFGTTITDVNCISCIGQDAFQSGVLAGRLLDLLVSSNSSVAVIEMMPVDDHIENRSRGFVSYFRNLNHIKVHNYRADGNGDTRHFYNLFKRMLKEHDSLKGVFVTNANTHKIAAQIEEMELEGKVHLVGYDLIEENIHYLREGVIDFLISQRPDIQGYQGINALYRHVVLNDSVREKIYMQIDIVAKENIDYYQDYGEGIYA
ncbi:LacI family DNA-binding transcriptional regulator [candidate division KSB1 bacterium]|nr:LacI family DNA-binding transcriptional regulator [candidate division KSB1 bacterium]RQW07143.1 MAG: LacI family DNA-binding transcriptional regulator [candidate division KSB1 bacterium]